MDKLKLYLTLEQVNLILDVLSHQPYRNVAITLHEVKAQADEQLANPPRPELVKE